MLAGLPIDMLMQESGSATQQLKLGMQLLILLKMPETGLLKQHQMQVNGSPTQQQMRGMLQRTLLKMLVNRYLMG